MWEAFKGVVYICNFTVRKVHINFEIFFSKIRTSLQGKRDLRMPIKSI